MTDPSDGARRRPGRRTVLAAGALAMVGGGTALGVVRRERPAGPRSLTLATGPTGAVFVEVGRDLSRAIEAASPATRVTTRATGASVDNLHLLRTAAVDLGFTSLDAAAVDGGVGPNGIRALARLYDSVLHLVVLAGSPIRALTDCTGRRVSTGAAGSGTEFTCRRLMNLVDVQPASTAELGQAEAMQAVADGSVDAAFSLTGFPTPAISDLARSRPVRLIPLGAYLKPLDDSIPGVYGPTAVPQGTYRGIPATDTVFVPNVLLARAGLADDVVSLVVGALLSPASRRFWTNPDSRRIDVRTAIATGPVPMHPAALAWLRAHKP
jgi:TRAP transporter TAXI family solute receptor